MLMLTSRVLAPPRILPLPDHIMTSMIICPPLLQAYMEQAQELVRNENILLQTLGFDVAIDHPHTHVVKCCQLVKASKELAQTSYFMATNRCDIAGSWVLCQT